MVNLDKADLTSTELCKWILQNHKQTQIPIPKKVSAALLKTGDQESYLPIESLKYIKISQSDKEIVRTFLSSGTSGDRSRSHFSTSGLDLYKTASLQTFYQTLGHFFEHPKAITGFSLIPKIIEWPDSSLAQMVDWISHHSRVEYNLDQIMGINSPVWVFGTGYHFIQAYDQGLKIDLPPGSIIIETGGTKTKSRSISRADLHEIIQRTFRVPKSRIVSEYGMCELASQAYEINSTNKSKFRFPDWVTLSVQTSDNSFAKSGIGVLTIHDRARTDLPWPIRTQDLVDLDPDGCFSLIGRVPGTTLKGCSLLAEELSWEKTRAPRNLPELSSIRTPATRICMDKVRFIHNNLATFFSSDEFIQSLSIEFGSTSIAQKCSKDLIWGLPQSIPAWLDALQNAFCQRTPTTWTIIQPQTHGIASIYPIIFAFCLELQVTLRGRRSSDRIENCILKFLDQKTHNIKLTDSSWRICVRNEEIISGLFIFGSDETVQSLSKQCINNHIVAHGSKITVTLTSPQELLVNFTHILEDMISLAHLGCLSTRAIFVLSDQSYEEFKETITNSHFNLDPTPCSEIMKISANHRHLEQSFKDYDSIVTQDGLVFTWHEFDADLDLNFYLGKRQYSYGFVQVTQDQQYKFLSWLSRYQEQILVLTNRMDLENYNFPQKEIGSSNRFLWNGKLDGKPLFY